MKPIHGLMLGMFLVAIGASAQNSLPERGKVGNDLSTALNGADRYLQTITNTLPADAGVGSATCAYVGTGFNVMAWCDAPCYVSNFSTGVDGGVLRLAEMVPLAAFTPYPVGLLDAKTGKLCVWQATDAGSGVTTNANTFRRY